MRLSNIQGSKLYIGILLTLSFVFVLGLVGQAQAGQFKDKSIKGTYAFTAMGQGGLTPDVAGGTATFDGSGNITSGSGFWNLPDGQGGRITLPITEVTGTYTVTEDGTGTGTMIFSVAAQTQDPSNFHFVITVIKKKDTVDKALEFFVVGDNLDPDTGNLHTFHAKKL